MIPTVIQDKGTYEKVGESTEVALKVLSEKLNVQGQDRASMTQQQCATACTRAVGEQYDKEFTLEFSRDRKSMSVYCRPKSVSGDCDVQPPLMFVKVGGACVCVVAGGYHDNITPGCPREYSGSV